MFRRQFENVVEHNYWTPSKKATYLISASNDPAAHILYGVPTGAMYEEVTEVLENRYSDHYLEAVFHSQLKRRTQLIGESLQKLAAAIDHLAHHAHVEPPKHLISKEATRAFAERIRKR
jgi:hypothetical protein